VEAETLTCSECGAENAPDAQACLACGADVEARSGPLAKIPPTALLGGAALILLIVLGVLARTLYTKSRPSSHTQTGLNYLDAGDHDQAKAEFKAALKYDGRYEQAIIGMARVAAATDDAALIGKFAKPAIAALDKGPLRAQIRVAYAWKLLAEEKASEANNEAIDALEDDDAVKGADALRGLSALQMNPPQEEDALLYLKKAVGHESKRAPVYSELSKLLLKREDFEAGESVTLKGLDLAEGDAELWLLLASHRRGRDDAKGVRTALQSALKIDADRADVHSRMSRVCLELKDPGAALKHARLAAKIAPEDSDAQLALGRILLSNGKPLNARTALEKAQRLRKGSDKDSWEVDYLLGKSQSLTKEASKGVRAMIKALKGREQERQDLVEETARLGVKSGSREATTFLRDMVKRFPDSYELNFLYAKIQVGNRGGKGKEKEIKRLLTRCLKLDPSRKDAPFLLGNFYLGLEKTSEAIAAWDRALSHHEKDSELLRAKGKAALSAELWDPAIDAFERLLKVLPSDNEAKAGLKQAQDGKFFSGN